ncbi:meiosis regulator and mRNA stability factor 1-like [Aphidius gifuensis]|uniref:meiosis regulator and mRNA stability factor 1-like n=1 Tax=Aphidius gifuensis TaxID=684658 RepID=UPI001CDB5E2E|nr:meiosis regulator and mRNA stability factor 1-like [Aphidius gifuensis]
MIHVPATYKNEKIKQSIRRFADIHGSSAAIILISSNDNFTAHLSDLGHGKKPHVILLNNGQALEDLIKCADEHHNLKQLMGPLTAPGNYILLVTNLSTEMKLVRIKDRLKYLASNCGGRV